MSHRDLVHSLTKSLRALSFSAMIDSAGSVARQLRHILHGDVEFDPVTRYLYSTDAGLSQIEPLGVVSPRDTEDVVRLVGYAVDRGLSLIPRGMGSGLNGAAVGPGIQVDFSRYMDSILEVSEDRSWVRVQPGVVLASLNRSLRPLGVFFPPDPSSENHCSLGGMIGTNASGARTVAYGATKDHVLSLELVMADASCHRATALDRNGPELAVLLDRRNLFSDAVSTVLAAVEDNQDTIRAHLPRVVKNSCGYRLETLLDTDPRCETASAPGSAGDQARLVPLQKLFVGSEGTLGIVTEATLNLKPLPARRGVAMAYFSSVFSAGEAVPGVLDLGPTAVEIMDARFIGLVRAHDPKFDAMLPARTDTALLIEVEAAEDGELEDKFAALRVHLDGSSCLQLIRAQSVAEADHLWRVRRSAVALMQRSPGPRQPLPFIEDITVHPSKLAECINFLQKLLDQMQVEAVMVGHAGDGNLHTRPVLDPRSPDDRLLMQHLYDEVSAYVLSLGGTLSGEHGDGLVHTPRLSTIYGTEIYDLFTRVKAAFDPLAILNPGKKVGPQQTDSTLFGSVRYGADYRTLPQRPRLHFPARGYENEIERCHGCAVCKSPVETTMCPSYRATKREHASPRAKANLLRAVITGVLDPRSAYALAAAKIVTDYCIECGLCAVECPSRVNIPKLMLEAKSRYRDQTRSRPVDLVLSRAEMVSRLASSVAPIANRVLSQPLARRLAECLLGIDRRRPIPPFARPSFRRGRTQKLPLGRGAVVSSPTERPKPVPRRSTVAYFCDLFADYNDPQLALAVERVLDAHGVTVVIPDQKGSAVPEMLYGYVARVRRTAAQNVDAVFSFLDQGALLVSAEPTATFAFKVHYPHYLATNAASLVADATRDLGEFLLSLRLDHPEVVPEPRPLRSLTGRADPCRDHDFSVLEHRRPLRVGYHLPCHLRAQEIGSPSLDLLGQIPGVEVIDLAAGCCGMAGTFGMRSGTYDLSKRIGKPLFERVARAAPDLLATECSTCRMQLAHVTGLEVVHPVTLLAEAYGS